MECVFSFPTSKKEKSSAFKAEDEKFRGTTSVYSQKGSLMRPKQVRRLYRALPVFAYWVSPDSAKPLRKVFHIPAPAALHQPATLWRNFLDMYWFSSTCYRYVLPSLALYPTQVNTQKRKEYAVLALSFCVICHSLINICFSEKNSFRILTLFDFVL